MIWHLQPVLAILALWNVGVERSLLEKLGDVAFTSVQCAAEACGKFREQAVFASRSECPQCGDKLTVRVAQDRNVPVSAFTEKLALQTVQEAVDKHYKEKFFVARGVKCPELSLTGGSGADLAILRRQDTKDLKPDDVAAVIEVKMSLIWNWKPGTDKPCADYDQHGGRPSFYRTDSLLKAIGKGAVLRATPASSRIPYLVIGNCPPPKGYYEDLDGAVKSGLVQKFISITPSPLTDPASPEVRNPKETPGKGFVRVDSSDELAELLRSILETDWVYMAGMVGRGPLGRMLKDLDRSGTDAEVAERFLRLFRKAD
jgi:hypothetical protein